MTPKATALWPTVAAVAVLVTLALFYGGPYALPAGGLFGLAVAWRQRTRWRSARSLACLAGLWLILGLALFSFYGRSTGVGGQRVVPVPTPTTSPAP
jgi:hypothetical protein